MGDQALLGRLVVIRRDDEQRIGADGFGMLGKLDRFHRVVGAGAGNDRHALGGDFHAEFDHPLVLVMGERRRFPRGADRHEAGGSLGNLPFHMGGKGLLVDRALAREGRDECGNGSLIHAMNSSGAEIHASAAF